MLYPLVRGVDVVADGRPDPGELGGRDRRADAGAADEHTTLGVAALDRRSDLRGLDRVVDPLRIRIRAQIHDGVALEHPEDSVAEMDATVVECNRHLHVWTVPHARQSTHAAS